ncbi:MAG: hypothetical protein SGILL_007120 [Bacillariaceae sp.]
MPASPSKPSSFQRKGNKRSLNVKFPEQIAQVVAEIEPCFSYTDEQRKDLWFARSDYHFSRQSARVIAKESERYGHSKHLEGVYISAFSQQVQDTLNLWALHGHTRRGLERWANSRHGLIRKNDHEMYEQGILRTQQEMKLKNACEGDKVKQAERLREVSLVLSRKSRLFAQMMGEADAKAVTSDRTATKDSKEETLHQIHAAVVAAGHAPAQFRRPPGSLPMFGRHPSQQQPRRNLGLGGPTRAIPPQRKVNRVADLPSRAVAPQFVSRTRGPAGASVGAPSVGGVGVTPKITIKPRTAGRVPRMA